MSCRASSYVLIKYNKQTKTFKGFTLPDSLINSIGGRRFFNSNAFAFSIAINSDGIIYLSGERGAIYFNIASEQFNLKYLEIPRLLGLGKRMLFTAPNKSIWFCTDSLGLATIDSGGAINFFHPTKISNEFDSYLCLQSVSDSIFWLGTKSSGLVVFNNQNHTFQFTNHVNTVSIPENCFISSCFKDRSGIVWLGTNKGILKADVRDNLFKVFPPLRKSNAANKNSFLGGQVLKDKKTGVLYMSNSSTDGLFSFNPATQAAEAFCPTGRSGIQNNIDNLIQLHTGEFLVLFTDTFYLFNPYTKKFSLFPYKLPFMIKDNIFSIFEDSKNNIWVGSYANGAYLINREKNFFKYFSKGKNDSHQFPDEGADMEGEDNQGRIWFVTTHGFCYYNPVDSTFHKPAFPKDFPKGDDSFREVCADKKGNVWIADYKKCLIRYRIATNSFSYYDLNNGLPDLYLRQMVLDKEDNIWVQSNDAVYKYNPLEQKYFSYNENDGVYTGGGINSISVDVDNQLYISYTNDRICTANINQLLPDSNQPKVVINDVKVFDTAITWSGNNIVLNHNQNYLTFNFAALSYSQPEKNKFAYQLIGIDKNWTYCDNRNFAAYNNLAPGNYKFTVKASNSDGVWNEQGALLNVTIKPAWWQTWWFRLLVAIALIAGVLILIREYTQRKLRLQKSELDKQRAIENVRNRISRDMHDEIGSSLTKISLMSELLKSKVKGTETESLLNKMSESSRNVIGNMSEIIWATNPQHDNMESMVAYFRDYIAQFFSSTQVHCTILFPDDVPTIAIAPELRRNLLLVIKESLNNILKHANASAVMVELKIISDHVEIIIQDSGKGFDTNEQKKFSNGLKNMRKRMEEVGGSFQVKSKIGKGTETRIAFKVKSSWLAASRNLKL